MGQYQQDFLNIKYCNLELAQRNSQASVRFSAFQPGGMVFCGIIRRWACELRGQYYGVVCPEHEVQLDYWITAGDTPDEIECAYSAVTGRVAHDAGIWAGLLAVQAALLEPGTDSFGGRETYHQKGIKLDVIVCDSFHWLRMGFPV